MIKIKRDFHTHATAYRDGNPKADHTVSALINRAADLGLGIIGVVEHMNDSPKHPTVHIEALTREFRSLRPQIECYVGAEVDIVDRSGNVTCPPELKEKLGLDYLLAAVHMSGDELSRAEAYVGEELRRHTNAMRNCPHIDVCAHPWESCTRLEKAGSIDRWSFDCVPVACQEELIETAIECKTAIEVNLADRTEMRDEAYIAFVKRLCDSGVMISIGSDAHDMRDMKRALVINNFLSELGIDDERLWKPGKQ
jgi:histidinol phosphatase-like PHP family hydrolase